MATQSDDRPGCDYCLTDNGASLRVVTDDGKNACPTHGSELESGNWDGTEHTVVPLGYLTNGESLGEGGKEYYWCEDCLNSATLTEGDGGLFLVCSEDCQVYALGRVETDDDLPATWRTG